MLSLRYRILKSAISFLRVFSYSIFSKNISSTIFTPEPHKQMLSRCRFRNQSKSKPMNAQPAWQPLSIEALEKKSIKFLMEKMGMTKKEIEEVNKKYGVSASQL